MSPFRAGAIALSVLAVIVYLGFTKSIPLLGGGFELRVAFESANSIKANSPVRIAGVKVGKVAGVDRADDGEGSVVTLKIDDSGLPIHEDATVKIRPRIFLEGNFFVDLQPGSPSAPELEDGDTVPITQTAAPVQLDEVLTALQSDARADLQDTLEGLGVALTHEPTAAEDRDQDPSARGDTAAESLNDTYDTAPEALSGAAIVNDALTGAQPRDLSRLVAGLGRIMAALESRETQLVDLVSGFNTTMAAFASREGELRTATRLLAPTVANANAALASLNAALPPTRAFAREVLPGIRETPGTIDAALPWIEQTRGLLSKDELQGVARDLRPATASLAKLSRRTLKLLPQLDLIARCANEVVLPTGDVVIQEGNLTTGVENYKEFWYTMVGLAGESQNFDGNGQYVRFQPGGGTQMLSTGASSLSGDALFGNALAKPLGTRPNYPGRRPPYRPDVPCHTQTPPNLNGPAAAAGAGDRAITRSAPSRLATRAARSAAATEERPRTFAEELIARLNPFAGGDQR